MIAKVLSRAELSNIFWATGTVLHCGAMTEFVNGASQALTVGVSTTLADYFGSFEEDQFEMLITRNIHRG